MHVGAQVMVGGLQKGETAKAGFSFPFKNVKFLEYLSYLPINLNLFFLKKKLKPSSMEKSIH